MWRSSNSNRSDVGLMKGTALALGTRFARIYLHYYPITQAVGQVCELDHSTDLESGEPVGRTTYTIDRQAQNREIWLFLVSRS